MLENQQLMIEILTLACGVGQLEGKSNELQGVSDLPWLRGWQRRIDPPCSELQTI